VNIISINHPVSKPDKDKSISLRISSEDLNSIKDIAKRNGLPYQTLIGSVLHKVAIGEIVCKVI